MKTSSDYAIDYGPEFLEKVRDMHAGAEELPDYEKWIIDHMGGACRDVPKAAPPADKGIHKAGERRHPGFWMRYRKLHGISSQISICQIPLIKEAGDLELPSGHFDFVLMNGVLEHVTPFRTREAVLLEAWRCFEAGGCCLSARPRIHCGHSTAILPDCR